MKTTIDMVMKEEERQLALLSFALTALLRPGLDQVLGGLADRIAGRDLYECFKESNRDIVGPIGAPEALRA